MRQLCPRSARHYCRCLPHIVVDGRAVEAGTIEPVESTQCPILCHHGLVGTSPEFESDKWFIVQRLVAELFTIDIGRKGFPLLAGIRQFVALLS